MKIFLAALAILSFSAPAYSADDDAKIIADLRAENIQLSSDLAKEQQKSISYFDASVAMRSKFEAAIQRINEANDVAVQWRSKAIGLERSLAYTEAIAQNSVNLDKTVATSVVPQFRISNVLKQPNIITPRDDVAPTYMAMR